MAWASISGVHSALIFFSLQAGSCIHKWGGARLALGGPWLPLGGCHPASRSMFLSGARSH